MTNPPESPYGPADSTPPPPPSEPLPPYDGTRPTEPLPPNGPPPPPEYPQQYPQQQSYPTAQYPPQPQQPLNAAQFYPQDQPPPGYTFPGQAPPKRGNGPGLAALILGISAIVLAFIPIVNFIAFFVGIAGIIVGIVGLAIANRPRAAAAWGTALSAVSLVLATVMVVVYTFGFFSAVSGAVDEVAPSLPQPTEINPPSQSPLPTEAVGDVHPLGTVVELTNESGEPVYEATVSASVLDATDVVSAIEVNPDAPAGMQWAMVTIELTSVADGSVSPAIDVTTEYVMAQGDTFSRLDAFALAPEPSFDALFNLEPGESGMGNVVVAIPTDDPSSGLWALSYGGSFEDAERVYFEVE